MINIVTILFKIIAVKMKMVNKNVMAAREIIVIKKIKKKKNSRVKK
jgi:hypothetical protein